MGCDIHAHLEIKIDEIWRYFAPVDFWRSYQTFSKMAGVRNSTEFPIVPIAQPRGLPGNVSFMTQFHSDVYGIDGHSHSWLTLNEMQELVNWFDNELGYRPWGARNIDENQFKKWNEFGVWLFGNPICGLQEYPKDYPESVNDVRLVFWFDN